VSRPLLDRLVRVVDETARPHAAMEVEEARSRCPTRRQADIRWNGSARAARRHRPPRFLSAIPDNWRAIRGPHQNLPRAGAPVRNTTSTRCS